MIRSFESHTVNREKVLNYGNVFQSLVKGNPTIFLEAIFFVMFLYIFTLIPGNLRDY